MKLNIKYTASLIFLSFILTGCGDSGPDVPDELNVKNKGYQYYKDHFDEVPALIKLCEEVIPKINAYEKEAMLDMDMNEAYKFSKQFYAKYSNVQDNCRTMSVVMEHYKIKHRYR